MGKCRFGASLFLCRACCFIYIYIYIFAPKNCHIAILIGYLFDYECIMGMAILCSSVLSAIYCHKNQRNIGVLEGFWGENEESIEQKSFFSVQC